MGILASIMSPNFDIMRAFIQLSLDAKIIFCVKICSKSAKF